MRKSIFTVCVWGLFAGALFLFSGCPVSPVKPEPVLPDGESIEMNSSLFVTDSGSGTVFFSTNDNAYTGEYGYTLWTEEPEAFTPFVRLNVTLSKLSGDDTAGYGVVFCSHDGTMLLVLINTKKEYLIGELTGNVFNELQGWKESSDLFGGYNQTNTLDITLDSGAGVFSLSFNGGTPVTFRDDEEPYHTGGKNGYLVVVSPRDDFPDVPVSVTFKEN